VNEATLVRELLERTTVPEPPIGPIAQNAIRAGLRLRRRRRIVQATATGAAAVAIVCVAALAAAGVIGHRAAAPALIPATVYVLAGSQAVGTVTPISTTTRRPGRTIVVRTGSEVFGVPPQLAVTPDGKTIWVADGNDNVTPISAATNRAGKPVRIVHGEYEGTEQVLATPDGKTVYVLDSYGNVTPISTATHKPGKPIKLGDNAGEMAITPDGKTLYIEVFGAPSWSSSYVIPIATATNRAGKPIAVPTNADEIVITPDGRTVYLIGNIGPEIEVTPIATASNRPGTPVIVGNGTIFPNPQVAMTPNGRTIYIPDSHGVIPFSTARNTPGKLISFGNAQVQEIAIAPDGGTAYVLSQPSGTSVHTPAVGDDVGQPWCTGPPGDVTPIATATNKVGTPIKVGCEPLAAAFTPDGRTLYVGARSGTVTPIATVTGRTGKPIKVDGPQAILIVPVPG
jgi:DNA-binding beta-propeller fold protein YncE